MIEGVLFLVIFLGVPVGMVATLVWLAVRGLRDRRAARRLVQEGPWQSVDDPAAAQHLLHPLGLDGPRVQVTRLVRNGPLWVCDWHRGMRTSPTAESGGERRRLLLVADAGGALHGTVNARVGGILEAGAAALGEALGAPVVALDGWDWAVVATPDPAPFTPARGRALQPHLSPGARLHLAGPMAALSLPEGDLATLMQEAQARADALRASLA